ncbi:MAG: hypothetical protein U0894_15065 [Pirellulales bacterium]
MNSKKKSTLLLIKLKVPRLLRASLSGGKKRQGEEEGLAVKAKEKISGTDLGCEDSSGSNQDSQKASGAACRKYGLLVKEIG